MELESTITDPLISVGYFEISEEGTFTMVARTVSENGKKRTETFVLSIGDDLTFLHNGAPLMNISISTLPHSKPKRKSPVRDLLHSLSEKIYDILYGNQ